MAERVFIGVAWPTPNGSLHLGHVAGCYLPADLFARYHRLVGDRVLMVSGTDQHGTPVTVRAEAEGVAPSVIGHRITQRSGQNAAETSPSSSRLAHEMLRELRVREQMIERLRHRCCRAHRPDLASIVMINGHFDDVTRLMDVPLTT